LVITPQTALPSFGKCGLQESSTDAIDTVSMFENCTRYNSLVSHPEQLEGKLVSALTSAFRRPRGPVHLSVPMDILKMPIGAKVPSYNVATMLRQPIMTDDQSLNALCEAVANALQKPSNKIVLFVGHGCADAAAQVVEFAELVGAEFVTTPTGKRWINPRHPLYRGVFGFAGHESATQALSHANVALILAVGTDLGELSTNGWDETALLNNKLVHIEPTMDSFEHSPMAYLHVYGHLRTVFETLHSVIARTPALQHTLPKRSFVDHKSVWPGLIPPGITVADSESCVSTASPVKPQRLVCELVGRLPAETRFVIDAGNAWCWATHYLHPKGEGNYHIAMGYGAMGWAIGAAVGTALGSKGRPVVCITGDGSFLMSGQEITVALVEQLPVLYVILNDQALGMVKHGQRLGNAEAIAYQLPAVDFAAMAKAMGVDSYKINTIEDLENLSFEKILSSPGPTLLDVSIDPEEEPPMKARVSTLAGL
jgi:acetolactate synthase-1/2/3 large subunit